LLAAVIHFTPQPISSYGLEQVRIYSWILLVGMVGLAILMVSTLRYASFKNIGPKSNKPFIILPLLSLLVAGIWFYSQWVLLILVSAYVSHGPLMKIWGFVSRFRHPMSEADESANSASIEI
jgi:CDP-diacylglycerol--serine O-phosphatidyltransferase